MLIPDAVSAEFFHTAAGTAFVDLLINGNRQTWPIRSIRFRTWLRHRHYEATRTAASAAAINSALDLLEAQAQFEGPERAVHVRLAEHAGHIYLDLADEYWRAVEVGPDGWRVIGSPPVRFPPRSGHVAAASPPRRRLHRGARILSQSAQPKRLCPGGGLAIGNTASRRPLSRASDLRRAGLG
jgi:hypothetical protein